MVLENRTFPLEVRQSGEEDGRHYITARVLNYNTPDSFHTTFKKGVFTKSLSERMPKMCVGHDWRNVIGRAVDYGEDDSGLDLRIRMSDFDSNSEAKRYYSHILDGELDEYSVGFERLQDEDDLEHRGCQAITAGNLAEISLVVIGSNPGTKTLSVRSEDTERIEFRTAEALLSRLSSGEIDLAEALSELKGIRSAAVTEETVDAVADRLSALDKKIRRHR